MATSEGMRHVCGICGHSFARDPQPDHHCSREVLLALRRVADAAREVPLYDKSVDCCPVCDERPEVCECLASQIRKALVELDAAMRPVGVITQRIRDQQNAPDDGSEPYVVRCPSLDGASPK
jgi:hypothetical protein